MNLIENLNWRYATKKFDASKTVSKEDIEQIKEATRLSASSYGLQPYKVLQIDEKNIREALKPVSWNQSQITDASHLFIICNYQKVVESDIQSLMAMKAASTNSDQSQYQKYAHFMMAKIGEKSTDEIANWTSKQAYIALGNMLAACAELKIDACPIEGFEADKYADILQLNETGLYPAVVVAVGYRSTEDASQYSAKVRKSTNTLFEVI